MRFITGFIALQTRGKTDIIDITDKVQKQINGHGMKEGYVNLFVPGSTGGLTTMEFEPNLVEDIKNTFQKIAPQEAEYAHHLTWGDYNGHSHVRAALLGSSLVVPFKEKKLTLGAWQQIVFIDFDTSGRNRKLILQIIGA